MPNQIHRLIAICSVFATAAFAEQPAAPIQQRGETSTVGASASTDGQVTVKGVVLDADRKALSGVKVEAVVLSRRAKDHPLAGSTVASVEGRATTDASGGFNMQIRTTSAAQDIALELFAYTSGYGIAGHYLDLGQKVHDVTLLLPKEVAIPCKLVGSDGKPLSSAAVRLCTLTIPDGQKRSFPFHTPPDDISPWPQPYCTDQDGTFSIVGASAQTETVIELDDPRAALQRWQISTGEVDRPIALQAEPPRNVVGQVVAGENSVAIERATVVLASSDYGSGKFIGHVTAMTDALGRFALRPYLGTELSIRVVASESKYAPLVRTIPWPDGTTTQRMKLALHGSEHRIEDGTTPDGQLASTIESDYPDVKVQHCRPSAPLTATLSGTIVVEAYFVRRVGDEREAVQGIIAVDPETSTWRLIAKDAREPRLSPDGKQLAYSTADLTELKVLSLPTIERPKSIAKKPISAASWLPGTKELVVNIHAPLQRDYYGEEYWGEESEKWRISALGGKLKSIPVPARYSIEHVSPDGRWLAMHWDTHASATGAQIFLSELNGSALRPIARKRHQYYWYPRFSPDGKSVLAKHLNATNDGPWISARIVALDGSNERSISFGEEFHAEYACWSPDGQCIAVATTDDPPSGRWKSKLFIVDSKGTQVRELVVANSEELRLGPIDWTAGVIAP